MGAKAIRVTKNGRGGAGNPRGAGEQTDLWYWTAGSTRISAYIPMVPAGASLNEVFDEEDMKNNEQSI